MELRDPGYLTYLGSPPPRKQALRVGPCRFSVNFLDCSKRKPTELVPVFLYLF